MNEHFVIGFEKAAGIAQHLKTHAGKYLAGGAAGTVGLGVGHKVGKERGKTRGFKAGYNLASDPRYDKRVSRTKQWMQTRGIKSKSPRAAEGLLAHMSLRRYKKGGMRFGKEEGKYD